MSIILRISVSAAGLLLILMARRSNIAYKMTERQSLVWIIGGGIIVLFGLVPQLIQIVSLLFQVEYPPSIIFAIAIMFAIYGIFDCYKTNAELSSKVQELAMQISLLNDENIQLKRLISSYQHDGKVRKVR